MESNLDMNGNSILNVGNILPVDTSSLASVVVSAAVAPTLTSTTLPNFLTAIGAVPKATVDAKGDLLVGTAADTVARKAVGTKGQLFVPDSTQSDGWVFKTAGTNGYALVADSTQSDGLIWTPYASAADNAVIGGDFSVNPWQRGTSFSTPASPSYLADRWYWLNAAAGPGTINALKTADAPTVAQAGKLITHCLEWGVAATDVAMAATDFYGIIQPIEGYRIRPLAQQSLVLQFWHKHTATGTYCVAVKNPTDRSYVLEYTQAVSGAWEMFTAVIPASPNAGTWDYTTNVGIYLTFTVAAGSNFQTTAGSWNAGSFTCTSNQINGMGATNNFKIAGVDLRPGNVVQPVLSRDFGTELALCQRYYTTTTFGTTRYGAPRVADAVTEGRYLYENFPVTMRAAPTVAITGDAVSSQTVSTAGVTWVWASIASGTAVGISAYTADKEL
jgi:hypothetical protein